MKPIEAALSLLTAAAVAALTGGCGVDGGGDRTLRRGMTAGVVTLDPHFSVLVEEGSLLSDLYEGLVRLDPQGDIVPGVAERWSVSEDGRVYTFFLRESAAWSDGSPLTAGDFVWAFRRLADPATASPNAGKLAVVAGAAEISDGEQPAEALGVEAVDERTLRIQLRSPAPYFLSVLADTALAPLHGESVERYDRLFTRAENLISNGPYRLARRAEHQYLELVRNPEHWDAGRASIERVRYVPYEEQSAQLTAYRVGDLDLTDVVPSAGLPIVRDQFPDEMHTRAAKDTFYYGFNLREGALAGEPALRSALSATIRREIITEQVTRIGQPPAYSFVPPTFPAYDPPRLDFAGDDQGGRDEAARRLAAGAESLRLRLLYNTSDGLRRITAATASMWRQAVGVDTELVNQEFGVFLQTLRDPSAWDVARLSWRADYDDPYAFLEIFESDSPNNFVGFSDPVYDELLQRSHSAETPSRRFALLREAERRLLDAHAIAPVYFYVDRVLAKPWIELGERERIKPLPTAELRWRK